MFCVECGSEGPLYEGLCESCFLQKNQFTLVPKTVDLLRCNHCLEFLIGGSWHRYTSLEEALADAIPIQVRIGAEVTGIQINITPQDMRNYGVELEITVRVYDLEKKERHRTLVRLKGTSCPRCSRIKGSYFESIIQVRSRNRHLDRDEMDELMGHIERRVESAAEQSREMFISKVEELHGGFDVYLSSNSLGRAIARELAAMHGAEFKESSSLVGKKEGKDVYRMTFLVRLPTYRLGDIVSFQQSLYRIEAISRTATRLQELRTHERITISNADLENVRVKGSEKDLMDAVVVSETEEELQLLHPVSYVVIEVKKPDGFKVNGETVKVFSHEGDLYLVPE